MVLAVGFDDRSSPEDSDVPFGDESASFVKETSGLSATSLSADDEVVRSVVLAAVAVFEPSASVGGGGASGAVGCFEIFVGSGSGNIRGAFIVSAGGGGGSAGGNIGGGGGALRRGGIGGGGNALMRSIPALDHSSS